VAQGKKKNIKLVASCQWWWEHVKVTWRGLQ